MKPRAYFLNTCALILIFVLSACQQTVPSASLDALGGSWRTLGGAVGGASSMVLGKDDRPIVAYLVNSGTPNLSDVYVKRWNGSAWSYVGSPVDVTLANPVSQPKLALRSDNVIVVAYQEGMSGN